MAKFTATLVQVENVSVNHRRDVVVDAPDKATAWKQVLALLETGKVKGINDAEYDSDEWDRDDRGEDVEDIQIKSIEPCDDEDESFPITSPVHFKYIKPGMVIRFADPEGIVADSVVISAPNEVKFDAVCFRVFGETESAHRKAGTIEAFYKSRYIPDGFHGADGDDFFQVVDL